MAYREFNTSSGYVGRVSVRVGEFDFVHGVKVSAVARFICPITHNQVSLDNIIIYHAGNFPLSEKKMNDKVYKAIGEYVKHAEKLDRGERAEKAMNTKFFRNECRTRR